MTEQITPEVFQYMVALAALELGEEEAEYLRRELNNQLKVIHELEAIPLDSSIKPTSHGVPYTPEIRPPARPDEWIPYPDPGDIIAQAPETEDGCVVVPDVAHIDLE
jgi:aspartyl-tRNA(Asn)/glutamyl-tRNA(Gln) amidotransferase subunit C